jgi:hypothetical protein
MCTRLFRTLILCSSVRFAIHELVFVFAYTFAFSHSFVIFFVSFWQDFHPFMLYDAHCVLLLAHRYTVHNVATDGAKLRDERVVAVGREGCGCGSNDTCSSASECPCRINDDDDDDEAVGPSRECGALCGCADDCTLRVTQRGVGVTAEVFRTSDGRGWGLRAGQAVAKDTYVRTCDLQYDISTPAALALSLTHSRTFI